MKPKYRTIVKVQAPVSTNDPSAPLLVYDRERRHVSQVIGLDALRKAMGGKVKAFFYATWDGKGWAIELPEAPWQEW